MSDSDKKPNRKRRWLRFSLRSFFLVVIALCVWLGWYVYRAERQKAAVQWVRGHGGEINYIGDVLGENPDRRVENWLRKKFGDDYVVGVEWVVFNSPRQPINDIQPLSSFRRLQNLFLVDTPVVDLRPIRSLRRLEYVNLSGSDIDRLDALANLTNLKYLHCGRTRIQDLSPLVSLPNLRALSIPESAIGDIASLKRLAALKVLNITGTNISQEDIDKLKKALPQECKITAVDLPISLEQGQKGVLRSESSFRGCN